MASSDAITTVPAPRPGSTDHYDPLPRPLPPAPQPQSPTHFVLAISWEPGFCAGKGNKPECAGETAQSFEATHFTLHGLWPTPRNTAGVAAADIASDKAGAWSDLPAVTLAAATRKNLDLAHAGDAVRA